MEDSKPVESTRPTQASVGLPIPREVAEKEVNSWLDYKKTKASKRESLSENIEELIGYVQDRVISLNPDTFEFTQSLSFPIGSGGQIKQLVFKPRVPLTTINGALKGVKTQDASGRVLAYIAALTGQNKAILAEMDTEDNSIGQSFAVFFI